MPLARGAAPVHVHWGRPDHQPAASGTAAPRRPRALQSVLGTTSLGEAARSEARAETTTATSDACSRPRHANAEKSRGTTSIAFSARRRLAPRTQPRSSRRRSDARRAARLGSLRCPAPLRSAAAAPSAASQPASQPSRPGEPGILPSYPRRATATRARSRSRLSPRAEPRPVSCALEYLNHTASAVRSATSAATSARASQCSTTPIDSSPPSPAAKEPRRLSFGLRLERPGGGGRRQRPHRGQRPCQDMGAVVSSLERAVIDVSWSCHEWFYGSAAGGKQHVAAVCMKPR